MRMGRADGENDRGEKELKIRAGWLKVGIERGRGWKAEVRKTEGTV